MPAWNRLLVTLRVIRVQNLAPGALFGAADVRTPLELPNYTLQIKAADSLKQSFAILFDVIRMDQRFTHEAGSECEIATSGG